MCSYCVVPYTRVCSFVSRHSQGRERSVEASIVMHNVNRIREHGYKEILLLGQNVNSYCDSTTQSDSSLAYQTTPGFRSPTSVRSKKGILFPELLERVAEAAPDVRIRFMSPHPKVMVPAVLECVGLPAVRSGGDQEPPEHLPLDPPPAAERQRLVLEADEPSLHARRLPATGRPDSHAAP